MSREVCGECGHQLDPDSECWFCDLERDSQLAPVLPFYPREVRVTSATGAQKGRKPERLSTVDPDVLLMLGEISNYGSEKYDAYNFLKGMEWDLMFDALLRHLLAFWAGEDDDPESGLPHMGHAMWHAHALLAHYLHGIGTDTRPWTVLPDPDAPTAA